MKYEEMKPEDYRRAKDAVPVAYLPWGAHEWHGLQNPLGTDSLKAHGQCLELCAETGGIVFPPVYCGHLTMKPHMGFDCTLEFSTDCIKLLAREYLDQIADEGFEVIVMVMGHYGPLHVEALQQEIDAFNARQDKCIAWGFPDCVPTDADGFPGDHAAGSETSYMMYFRPELVDLARLPQDHDLTMQEDGIGGSIDPRTGASAKRGRDGTASLVRNVAPRVRELLKEKTGNGELG